MKSAGISVEEIDWIVPHQANIGIIHGTAKKMGITSDHVLTTVQDHGNTSTASIPSPCQFQKSTGILRKMT